MLAPERTGIWKMATGTGQVGEANQGGGKKKVKVRNYLSMISPYNKYNFISK